MCEDPVAALRTAIEKAKGKQKDTTTGGRTGDGEERATDAGEESAEQAPFICLGKDGREFVYYARLSEEVVRLKPTEHNKANLLLLARPAWWKEVLGDKWCVDDAICYCYDAQGKRRFSSGQVRGAGIWEEEGVPLYNAGDACFSVRQGRIVEVAPLCPQGLIYERADALPHPTEAMLTDEEGQALIDYLSAYDWRDAVSPLLLAGFVVQGMMAGYVKTRAHVWINAPAGTGKSRMVKRLRRMMEGLMLSFTGGTSEAGIRQMIGKGARPVMLDEMEAANGDRHAQAALEKLMSLVRRATDGEKSVMGGQDAVPVEFRARSAFALFSIGNSLRRAADASRFINLHIHPNGDESVFERRDRAAARLETVNAGKLISRVMLLAHVIVTNADVIGKTLSANAFLHGRRAELLGMLLAGAHALTHDTLVSEKEVSEYANLIGRSEFAEVEENDAERCLREILESRVAGNRETVGFYVSALAQAIRRGEAVNGSSMIAELNIVGIDLYTPKGQREEELPFLFLCDRNRQLSLMLEGTDWRAGWADILRHLPGAIFIQQKRIRMGRHKGVAIPMEVVWKN